MQANQDVQKFVCRRSWITLCIEGYVTVSCGLSSDGSRTGTRAQALGTELLGLAARGRVSITLNWAGRNPGRCLLMYL